jgi:hypothetical protein
MLGSPLEKYACADFIIRSSEHWYNYPLMRLKDLPQEQAIVVKFDDLVGDTEGTISRIYKQFGLSITEDFQLQIKHDSKKARNHKSQHLYSLSEMGISKQEMMDRFGSVMDEFGFTT